MPKNLTSPALRANLVRTAAALSVLAIGAVANANLVTNGSFENGTATTIDNWVVTPPAGPGNVSQYPSANPSIYGDRFLTLNQGQNASVGSATNDFGTATLGVTYQVDFVYGQFGGQSGEQTLIASIADSSVPNPLQSQVYTNITPSTDFATLWRTGSFTFVGTGLPTSITFTDVGSTGFLTSDLLVDNVSVNVVPEPATMAALGFGALALMRRRSKRS